MLGLAPERERLRAAVEARTREMFERGLVRRGPRAAGARAAAPLPGRSQAIGYRQAVAVLRGDLDRRRPSRSIVTETMRYAKRQMTWFRHQATVEWFPNADGAHAAATVGCARPHPRLDLAFANGAKPSSSPR